MRERRINYIGFDLDGTLVDTISGHLDVFRRCINKQFPINPEEAKQHYIATSGLPTLEQICSLLEKHNIDANQQQSIALAKAIDNLLEDVEAKPYPEIETTLQKLRQEEGYNIFVSSAHTTEAVERILQRTNLLSYVDFFVGVDYLNPDFKKGEPHLKAVSGYFYTPYEEFIQRTVFVGDGLADMEAAKKCKVFAIGRIGIKTADELIKAGANITLSNLSTLPEVVQSL